MSIFEFPKLPGQSFSPATQNREIEKMEKQTK